MSSKTNTDKASVVTRMAPSPTGALHVGTVRAALFNYLYARHHGGSFILRFEDTDKERSKVEHEKEVLEGLKWLGFTFDSVVRQSERASIHTTYLEKLVAKDAAYISREPSKQDSNTEIAVIRLRNKNKVIEFTDMIRGNISVDTTDLGDFVIARAIDDPLYHFAVVVDDHEMNVTHVIRGDDHISNTPRQILIQQALEIEGPEYAHLPLILGVDRSKLSKRNGTVSFREYQEKYLPEAIMNYLALLGWNPGTNQEMFTLDELIQEFSIKRVGKAGAIFDETKLSSINHLHLKSKTHAELVELVRPLVPETIVTFPLYTQEKLSDILPIMLERIQTLKEIEECLINGEYDYFFTDTTVDPTKLSWKETSRETTKSHLMTLISCIDTLDGAKFTAEALKEVIWDYADKNGRGEVLWPMRMALSGKDKSPDPFVIASILGKEETLIRLHRAFDTIGE